MDIKKEKVLFSSLMPEPAGTALDRHLKKNGWELQAWDTGTAQGYQLFFGQGVQVDNFFEYGFPYLYDKEELLAFAERFYESRVRDDKPSLSGQIEAAEACNAVGRSSFCVSEKELEPGR